MYTRGHSLTLGLLPEHKINWRSLATSYGTLTLLIILLINLGLFFPDKIQLQKYHISSWIPVALKPPAPEAPRKQIVPPVVSSILSSVSLGRQAQ